MFQTFYETLKSKSRDGVRFDFVGCIDTRFSFIIDVDCCFCSVNNINECRW